MGSRNFNSGGAAEEDVPFPHLGSADAFTCVGQRSDRSGSKANCVCRQRRRRNRFWKNKPTVISFVGAHKSYVPSSSAPACHSRLPDSICNFLAEQEAALGRRTLKVTLF